MAVMRKLAIASLCIVAAACTVYFVYFRHPPAASILDNNKKSASRLTRNVESDYSYEDDYDEEGEETAQSSKRKWERWIQRNGHVSIGELYNKCGEYGSYHCVAFSGANLVIF